MKRLMAVFFLVVSSLCFAATVDDVKEKYASIRTFRSRFTQTLFLANMNSKREFSGDFYFKRGKGFLWVYKTPRLRYFLFDGVHLYQYDEERPFITKEKIEGKTSQSYFLDLIDDMGNLDKHFVVKERVFQGSSEIVKLEPKKEGMINSVRIWFGRDLKLDKIEIMEKNGNSNTLVFKSIVLNGEIEDERFIFKNEKGKQVIER